jgi:hypothetical protein
MINRLPKTFIGTGEVKNFIFKQIKDSSTSYIYQINNKDEIHYEVILKRDARLCINFIDKVFSEDESKEIYPKSTKFGLYAWTYRDLDKAIEKFNLL